MHETFDSINRWQRETFPGATVDGVLKHIGEEWEEFQLAATDEGRAEEAVDLIILLSCYLNKVGDGTGAQGHVDRKMDINRARIWNIQGDGTGRHVRT